jgi:hypothetical protein
MPQEYYMSPNNPCPSCGGSHVFTAEDGVPYWERPDGVSFRVVCPDTGAIVEVSIPQEEPAPVRKMTDLTCTTCQKANYFVLSERRQGAVIVQRLQCANDGCQAEFARHLHETT